MDIENNFQLIQDEAYNEYKYNLKISRLNMKSFLINNFKLVEYSTIKDNICNDEISSAIYKFKRNGYITLRRDNSVTLNFFAVTRYSLHFNDICTKITHVTVWERDIEEYLPNFYYSLSTKNDNNIPVSIIDENDVEYTKKDIFTYLYEFTNFICPMKYTGDIFNYLCCIYDKEEESSKVTFQSMFEKKYLNKYSLKRENFFEHTADKIGRHWLFRWMDGIL